MTPTRELKMVAASATLIASGWMLASVSAILGVLGFLPREVAIIITCSGLVLCICTLFITSIIVVLNRIYSQESSVRS